VAIAAAMAAAATLVLAGAAGASSSVGALDLSSRDNINTYLLSKGLDPSTFVWQEGPLNYAGPSCPGPGWNCTSATQVIQISQAGGQGQNKFDCEPEEDQVTEEEEPYGPFTDPDANQCVIVQGGDTNHARCHLRDRTSEPLVEQTCMITQDGVRNTSVIQMLIDQTDSPEEDALQRAIVDQDAVLSNHSQIHKTITQLSGEPDDDGAQKQDAFQLADVDQTATGSDNFSHVHQAQHQRAQGEALDQMQNTEPVPRPEFDCGVTDPDPDDLVPEDKLMNPNQCANVLQDVLSEDGGKNESHLHQATGEEAKTTMEGDQQQGSLIGGQEGDIHQELASDETGSNHNVAHQDLVQHESGPPGTGQEQFTDPGCCGVSQRGGRRNREDIKQSTKQSASEGDEAFQVAFLSGVAHQTSADDDNGGGNGDGLSILQGDGSSEGSCSIMHHGRNNSGADHFKVSASPCPLLVLETVCANSAGAEEFGFDEGCSDPDPIVPDVLGLSAPTIVSFPTAATLGLPVDMPSFGEPADYLSLISSS
jgi:hypothetical protein